tara:strand:+ start:980 stop:1795 length:816 start_codon:yes stop_codon:yes gene_type:complete
MYLKKKCQDHLWLLTGTGEGYVFAESLLKEGWKITVSVVSERASYPYQKLPIENIMVGPLMNEDEIRKVIINAKINQNGFLCVIDLTHPFALKITPSVLRVCRELDQPFVRYERKIENISNAFLIKSFKDLSDFDLENKSILLAVGVRKLQEAINATKAAGAKAYSRILANPNSLKKILSSSISKNNFAVLNPSVGSDGLIEKALVRKWKIDGVVCRQSGGVTEILWHKICSSMNIKLWLLARPQKYEKDYSIDSYDKLSKRLQLICKNKV